MYAHPCARCVLRSAWIVKKVLLIDFWYHHIQFTFKPCQNWTLESRVVSCYSTYEISTQCTFSSITTTHFYCFLILIACDVDRRCLREELARRSSIRDACCVQWHVERSALTVCHKNRLVRQDPIKIKASDAYDFELRQWSFCFSWSFYFFSPGSHEWARISLQAYYSRRNTQWPTKTCCSSVRRCGTHHAQTVFPKSSVWILWTDDAPNRFYHPPCDQTAIQLHFFSHFVCSFCRCRGHRASISCPSRISESTFESFCMQSKICSKLTASPRSKI